MQHALRSKRNKDERIEETARAHFSRCPFCGTEHSISREKSLDITFMSCMNCRREWRIIYAQGAIWFLRKNGVNQDKLYSSSWIVHRSDGSLEGIRPYILLEPDFSKTGKQKVIEQGLDKFLWKNQSLLEYFDKYDEPIKGHSCERVTIAFACARMIEKEEKDAANGSGLSVKQIGAITNLSEYDVLNCTQRLLAEGSISYDVRPEEGLTGTEAVIMGFLGEPLYQMDEYSAEKVIKELMK